MAREITASIDDLDGEGAGIGHGPDGEIVHVAQALPGERVRVAVEHVSPHGRGVWGRLVDVESPSPSRVAPGCGVWGECGGCPLLIWRPDEQLVWKRATLERALAGLGARVSPCVPSPRLLGYRNRAKLVFGRVADHLLLGAFAPRSHRLVDVSACPVNAAPLSRVATTLARLVDERRLVVYDEASGDGDLRHALLRVNHRGEVLVLLVVARRGVEGIADVAESLRRLHPEVQGVVENLQRGRGNAIIGREEPDLVLSGADHLDERFGEVELRVSAGAFLQVNREVATMIYAEVARLALPGRAIDLYCGVGGIALTLASGGREVVGVEEVVEAVADARAAARAARLERASFEVGDAGEHLTRLAQAGTVVATLVVNPPRKGLDARVLEAVLALRPREILYVSCSPSSLARDLRRLVGDYEVSSVTPFDMLPNTPHVEALAHLIRRATG